MREEAPRHSANTWVAVDLEATSPDPQQAHILEIAAQDLQGNTRHWYVATLEPVSEDHEAFRLTGIPFSTYEREKLSPERALRELRDFIGDRPLLGHNLLRYDLPLLNRSFQEVGLPPLSGRALDTLRLAHLVFPTPPEALTGYRLGDLYRYFTGEELTGAHRAGTDVAATWKVFTGLLLQKLPDGIAQAWQELGLPEADLYPKLPGRVKDLLQTPTRVESVDYEGQRLPHPSRLGQDLLPTRRPPQDEMFWEVEGALRKGKRLFLEAPTGTGKTKGYLYPALHLGEKTWVATHTKVLQAQALEELRGVGQRGYRVKAALVKSPGDALCPEALFELFLEARKDEDEELRAAVGMLVHYAALGGYDLEALPAYWHFSRGFREARDRVGTNPRRCRPACPFFHTCGYQKQLAQRKNAQIWVTNQAYLLASFLRDGQDDVALGEDQEKAHLILDEAHHLEDVATEAFTVVLDHEELLHRLHRLAHPQKDKGLLRDTDRLKTLSPEAGAAVKEIAEVVLPKLYGILENYSHHLVKFIKDRGSGDPRYGLTLPLGSAWLRLDKWPYINREEVALLEDLKRLQNALRIVAEGQSPLAQDLAPIQDYLQLALNLLWARRQVLGLAPGEPDPNLLHLSEWDPLTDSWRHLAQPIDVSAALRGKLWPRFKGLVLTSATLTVPTEADPEGFAFLKRVLGLEEAESRRLPPSLPYEKAHLLVPRHLPEARESTLPRFQRMLHVELRTLLPKAHRSLTLFTSLKRLEDAKEALEGLPHLLVPLTRKEREDVASRIKQDPEAPVAALGSRSYMEGVDFPALKLVNLERIPFPLPSPLLNKRMERVYEMGLDAWWDYYLPKATLSFTQAFGRLIRDNRHGVGDGAFILWDKKLLNAAYQEVFYRALPAGVHWEFPEDRKAVYDRLAKILGVDRAQFPEEELEEEASRRLKAIVQADLEPLEKARRIAEDVYGLRLDEARWAKQVEAIGAALEGEDLVALLPTGFGKSLAFQIPALLEEGLTLVISPLVALMKDQADRLMELGLPVGAVHSLMGAGEQRSVLDEVRAGQVRLLYVSPERVNRSHELWRLLEEVHRQGRLRRVVFDEAHCLLEWGFDFRPDYLKALARLLGLEGVPKSFFTATLTPKDLQKLKEVARLDFTREVRPESFHRQNLRFVVTSAYGERGKFQVLAKAIGWLLETSGSGIVYTATRAEAERLAWALGRLYPGLGVEAYHAGLGPVPRREAQERFMEGKIRVMVATTAFGMGIDKPDIRLVVHWRPPRSLEEYIQQAGRAGRDGEEAYCLLLYTKSDWSFLEWAVGVAQGGKAQEDFVQRMIDLLATERDLVGYRRALYQKVYETESEEEAESLEAAWDDDEEESEEMSGSWRELGIENLERTFSGLERAGILEYEYLPGKALLLAPKNVLRQRLAPEEMALLEKAGYQGSERGDVLDFSRISPEEAQVLDEKLYRLCKTDRMGLYHYREPLLHVRAGERLEVGYRQWHREQREAEQYAKERLKQVRHYAEKGVCRARTLLKHLGESLTNCGVCDVCAQDPGPWEALEQLSPEELERAYHPLDTLLAFFAQAEESAWSQEPRYMYLGKSSTLMALRGKDRSQNGTLGRKYTDNRFFGHLSFLRPKELEQAFERAVKEGYLEEKDDYEGQPLFGLTKKGWDRYRRQQREVTGV